MDLGQFVSTKVVSSIFTMASSPSLALSFLVLLVLATFTTTTVLATNNLPPSSAPALSPASSAAAKEFLRATCTSKSELPELCFDILLPYASSFNGSQGKVARASAAIASERHRGLLDELRGLKPGPGDVGAERRMLVMLLSDCVRDFDATYMFADETLARIDFLVSGRGSEEQRASDKLRANVWLTSAMDSGVSCTDWFNEEGSHGRPASSPVGKKVIAGCATATQYMSIALELLVNCITT